MQKCQVAMLREMERPENTMRTHQSETDESKEQKVCHKNNGNDTKLLYMMRGDLGELILTGSL